MALIDHSRLALKTVGPEGSPGIAGPFAHDDRDNYMCRCRRTATHVYRIQISGRTMLVCRDCARELAVAILEREVG